MISDNQKKLSQEDIDILSGKKTPKVNQGDIDALMGKSVSRVNPAASPADTLNVEVGAKGSIADRMNNPGNLTFAGQPGATQDGQWAKFESAYEGFNALKRDINAKKKRGYTLGEALTLYSKPVGGEVDSNYLNNIAKHLNVSLDAPFGDMDTHDVAEAVAKFESGTKIEKINPTPDFSGKYLGNIIDTAVKEGKKVSLPKPPATESLKQQFSSEEKAMLDAATGNVDKWYNERGGLTPQKKMDEFSRRIKEITSKYEQDVLYVEKQEELDQINSKFTEEAKAIANELGLETTEDGSIKPYDNEMNQYLGRLESELGFEGKARQGKPDSYMNDFMDRLAAGTHRFTANMVDLAGFLTGANMFEGFKNLSEGQRYRADQFVQQSQRYDKTIEELAKNGDVKEAAGLAVMSVVESLPAMIPMFLNPEYGIYAMGAGAAMERYRGIENENIPQWQKILDSVANGANEMIWEKAVTVPILAKSKQAMMSLGRKKGQEVVRASVEASLKNSAYKAGGSLPSWVAEGLSEVATGVSNDIADKIYVDPNTQIGSHAFDDMVVGAVMGKAFSTPSDVATFLNKNDQRKLINKVLKSVPKDLGYEPYMNLVEVLSEREALTDMENNLAAEFKGKYTPRIVELTDKANKIIAEAGGKTVGNVEPDNGMQAKVDYLIRQGVKIPDGATSEGVDQLWKETKQKETETLQKPEAIKTKESEKLTESQQQNVDTQQNNVSEVSPELTKTGTVEKVGEQKLQEKYGKKVKLIPTKTIDALPRGKTNEDISAAKDKIEKEGEVEPIILTYYAKDDALVLSDGHHRLAAAKELGIEDIPVKINVSWGGNVSESEVAENKGVIIHSKKLDLDKFKKDNYYPSNISPEEIGLSIKRESEVQNAEEIARQVSPTVPQEGAEGGEIGQGSVFNTKQDKATAEQVAPATEEKKEEKKVTTKKKKDDKRNGRDGRNVPPTKEVRTEQEQEGRVVSPESGQQATEEREKTSEADTEKEIKTLFQELDLNIPATVINKANKAFLAAREAMNEADAAIASFKAIERSDWFKKLDKDVQQKAKEKYHNEITERFTSRPTEKTKREKMPSQEFDTKETVSVRQTILKEIAMLQKVAKEVVKNVEDNFKQATKSVTDKLKDAVNKKHITDGQYRGIISRLSNITVSERTNKQGKKMSDKRLEDLNDYVAKVLEKADYKDALLKAKKLIKDVSDKNRRDKSIFGDAKKLADDFSKIDPNQLTLEEIEEFNKFAEKILSYRKVPNIASLEAAVNQFGDKTKSEEDAFMQKLEDAVTAAELGAPDALVTIRKEYSTYVDEIIPTKVDENGKKVLDKNGNEVKEKIDTVSKYMTARRKAAVARRKLGKMLDSGVLTEEEAAAYWNKITPEENGELEQMLAEFKKEYAKTVKEAAEDKKTKDAINNLTEQEQEPVRELMAAKQDQIERLSISEIEALDNIVKNLQLGYLTPEVFQLRRKLNAMNKVDTMLGGFVEKILTPKNLARLKKIAGDKAVTNLTRWIDGMKTYRLDEMLGNTNRYKTINAAAGSAISKAAQRESNLNEYFQKKRLAINKILDRKFSTSVGETLLASKTGRKIGKLMGREMKFTNTYNKMREFTNFLIERSYQQEEIFKNGKFSEETHSRLAAQFIIDPRDRAKDNVAEFHNDQMLYERQLAEAKELGLTKEVSWKDKDGNIVKRDVIDTEKYEEHLRKDPEMAKLIDMVDAYFEEVKPYAKVATMENGRTFIGKQLYFPFRGKESGREANEEDIKKHLEHTNQYPKMQANATHARKGSDMWLDNDIMKVMEYHTKEVMRNYFVYPEVRATMEALEKSFTGNMEARKGEMSKVEKETAMALRDSLKDTFKKRVAKYYNSGKYSVDYNKWLDPLLKAGKQGMLLNPIRPLAEIPANVLRATIATGYIPAKVLKMNKKDKAVMDALFNDYMGDRYWSAYSSELGAVSAKRLAMKKIQDMADWFIMISDKAVGRPLLRNEFLVSFKELTGQEFDVQKFSEDVDYRIEYKDQIHQSAAWAVKRVEELFNEKSPLSSALLTNFVGGAIKANPQKTTTKIFDILQSFSRNEVEQLRTAAARRNDPDMGYMVARDITAVMLSNLTYQILRRGLGVAFSVGMAQLLGQALSDYEEEQKKELLSDDAFWRDLRRSAEGLMMGGSANIYSLAFRVGYYVVNNADILNEDQKKFVEETMIEDLYASKIGAVGTPKGILMSVLPIPSTMTKDAFNTLDGFSALLSAVFKSDATEEQKLQIFNLINMGIKYSMPNLISPVIQKSLERKINEEKRSSKETTDGENTSSIWADEDTETTAIEENTSSIWNED